MAGVIRPCGEFSSGKGSTAYWLPLSVTAMPTSTLSKRDQRKVERLLQQQIILESKIKILQRAYDENEELLRSLNKADNSQIMVKQTLINN